MIPIRLYPKTEITTVEKSKTNPLRYAPIEVICAVMQFCDEHGMAWCTEKDASFALKTLGYPSFEDDPRA